MSMQYDPQLYDLDKREFLQAEAQFYVDICKKLNPKNILEIGVGTGRILDVLLPLVSHAVGIDNNQQMIQKAYKRLKAYSNYKLSLTDMRNLSLHEKFDLIYIPFNTFQHLLTEFDQRLCINSISRHLKRGGYFILDLMHPDFLKLNNSWQKEFSAVNNKNENITRYQRSLKFEADIGVAHKQFKYYNHSSKEILTFDAIMKITDTPSITFLLNAHGLEVLELKYGYTKDQISKRIFICQKIK